MREREREMKTPKIERFEKENMEREADLLLK